MKKTVFAFLTLTFFVARANAFFEDICQPHRNTQGRPKIDYCVQPTCPDFNDPNSVCREQMLQFLTVAPGRSMIHADATYFLAQALGYRADVAYWIVAYNETSDHGDYNPIDQCGVQAAAANNGHQFMGAAFNGFVRTNMATDGPLDHYLVPFSPNGQGTDVHGAGGVQALYPFHYPPPGYPTIDNRYETTLANLRQWAMLPTNEAGTLCAAGLMTPDKNCVEGVTISGVVPVITTDPRGVPIVVKSGRKVLNFQKKTDQAPAQIDTFDRLEAYLNDPNKTIGKVADRPVPVQVARFGLYLHSLQDSSSHATYCGDDAPTPPGGCDRGTYMYAVDDKTMKLSYGSSCAQGPHLAGHIQETGTGNDKALPLRVYASLNITLDELIEFGNKVAKTNGWIANPDLLPPDLTGPNGRGQTAEALKKELVGTITSGQPYSRGEVYSSGVVTLPLQQPIPYDRLHAMNKALVDYGKKVQGSNTAFTPFQPMPGNSDDPSNTTVCWH